MSYNNIEELRIALEYLPIQSFDKEEFIQNVAVFFDFNDYMKSKLGTDNDEVIQSRLNIYLGVNIDKYFDDKNPEFKDKDEIEIVELLIIAISNCLQDYATEEGYNTDLTVSAKKLFTLLMQDKVI